VSIERAAGTIIPRGQTLLQGGDRLVIFVHQDQVNELHEHLAALGADGARTPGR
jgi:Trk K+ transport system NAD-binding subunit